MTAKEALAILLKTAPISERAREIFEEELPLMTEEELFQVGKVLAEARKKELVAEQRLIDSLEEIMDIQF